jgi:hypothetical protein
MKNCIISFRIAKQLDVTKMLNSKKEQKRIFATEKGCGTYWKRIVNIRFFLPPFLFLSI